MDRSLAVGIATFSVLLIALDLAFQALSDMVEWHGQFTTLITYFIAAPIALWMARKAGRVTHVSVLLASAAAALATLGTITFLFDLAARPVGHVPWNTLFNETFWRHTTTWSAMALLAPQLWLIALNRYVAANSSNPMRLRRTGQLRR